jgi:hypothetical protein
VGGVTLSVNKKPHLIYIYYNKIVYDLLNFNMIISIAYIA